MRFTRDFQSFAGGWDLLRSRLSPSCSGIPPGRPWSQGEELGRDVLWAGTGSGHSRAASFATLVGVTG